MGIPTRGLTERTVAAPSPVADINPDTAAKLDALLAEREIPADSVAAKTGGDPDATIKVPGMSDEIPRVVEIGGGLHVHATKERITVLDHFAGGPNGHIITANPEPPPRIVPPLSKRTIAEMEAGRKKVEERAAQDAIRQAARKPEPEVDGTTVGRPGAFNEYAPTFKTSIQTRSKDMK